MATTIFLCKLQQNQAAAIKFIKQELLKAENPSRLCSQPRLRLENAQINLLGSHVSLFKPYEFVQYQAKCCSNSKEFIVLRLVGII